MTYLEKYDALSGDREKVALVSGWIRTDTFPFFRELRERRPIFVTPGFTLVTRFPDVMEVLSHEKMFSVRLYASRMDPVVDGPFMLSRDDTPVNWREKGIMQAVLRPEDLPDVREAAGRIADESLDRSAPSGRIDVVSGLGRYVPIRLCGEYFGFPGPDLETMYRWSRATQFDMFKNLQNDPVVHEESVCAGKEMMSYLRGLLEDKRAAMERSKGDPPQDVFGRLIRTSLPAELGFDDHRILANVAGLLIGAGETASQAIVQVLEQILSRPDVRARAAEAAAGPDLAEFDRYVWEALRFNPINPLVFRYCEQDYELAAGTPRATLIPAGAIVFACTASAMFDEHRFPDGNRFRTDRPEPTGLHFGFGHHACLGRQVAGVMVPEVVRRVLLRPGTSLLSPPDGNVDFQGGPFPERFTIFLGTDA
ncbi:cytochrome P450 [Actinocorallia aurantiaca]|uniref:Cytochrome P450 n=1 Tax=Actinocorallia aurantiaca TaxID=46204 RepID=A0ABP6GNP3_9ACTN